MRPLPDGGAEAEDPPEPPRLRRLRRLVTLLLMVLIAGVSAVVIALLLKLKEIRFEPAAAAVERPAAQTVVPGLQPGERLIEARASATRITLMLEDAQGRRRVVVLDGADFRPLGALSDAPDQR